EGHRVDGRSDIFSLGVVLYELLTGRLPFQGKDRDDLLEQIITREARPPRQIDDRIPRELERICLKALAKRACDRYSTACDMADHLRVSLREQPQHETTTAEPPELGHAPALPSTKVGTAESSLPPIRIVPKGLRSFDEGDADYFLELLPGPRD